MLPTGLWLTIASLLVASTAEATPKDFSGRGQIRTLYIGGGHDDLGCLTNTGQWTVDETQCGSFVGVQVDSYSFRLSSPEAGSCGVDVATFKCGGGVQAATFGTFGPGIPARGREVLRYGQYGVLATDASDSPPAPTGAPLAIHFYSGSEGGKWVWLGWKSLEDGE